LPGGIAYIAQTTDTPNKDACGQLRAGEILCGHFSTAEQTAIVSN